MWFYPEERPFSHQECSYLEDRGFLEPVSQHADMAIFCLEYLSSAPFDLMMSEKEVQTQFLEGYYTFANYAASLWVEHTAILERQTLPPGSPIYDRVKSVLTEFLLQTQILSQAQLDDVLCKDDVHISNIVKPCIGERILRNDWTYFEMQLSRICSISENIFKRDLQSPKSLSGKCVVQMYGNLRYRCPKLGCIYFTRGLLTPEIRDKHLSQHSRPFVCTEVHCLYQQIGFDTCTKLERHQTLIHKDHNTEDIPKFPRAKKSKGTPQLPKAAARDETEQLYELRSKFAFGDLTLQNEPNLNAGLKRAVEDCHLEICKFLVYKGASVREDTIYSAMKIDNIEIMKYLASVAQAEPRMLCGERPLHGMLTEAIKIGDLDKFELALSFARPPWNDAKELGAPILRIAVQRSREWIARFIIASSEMDLDLPDSAYMRPLLVAIETCQPMIVNSLLDSRRINPNGVEGDYDTPLCLAIAANKQHTAQMLIATGRLDPNGIGRDGLTPLAQCIVMNQMQLFLELLAAEGTDPNFSGHQIITPLMIAVLYRRNHMTESLVHARQSNLEVYGPSGLTALWYALVLNYREIAETLLNAGAEANDPSSHGSFPYRESLNNYPKRPLLSNLFNKLAFAENVLLTARHLYPWVHSISWSDRDEWRSAVDMALDESQRSPREIAGLEKQYKSKFNLSDPWSDPETGLRMVMLSPAEHQILGIEKAKQEIEALPRHLRAAPSRRDEISNMEAMQVELARQEQENKNQLRVPTLGEGHIVP